MIQATQETCRHGHPRPSGQRCRTCHREGSKLSMARAREDGRPTAERHDGHDVTTTKAGRPYCRTCKRGELDVDEVAVARAVAGEPPERLTPAEREAAIAQLLLMGYGAAEIARRVNCHRTRVMRIRDQLGVAARKWERADRKVAAPAVQEATDA